MCSVGDQSASCTSAIDELTYSAVELLIAQIADSGKDLPPQEAVSC